MSILTKFHIPYSINPKLDCPKCKPAPCRGHTPVNHYGVIMFDWQAAFWNLFAYCWSDVDLDAYHSLEDRIN